MVENEFQGWEVGTSLGIGRPCVRILDFSLITKELLEGFKVAWLDSHIQKLALTTVMRMDWGRARVRCELGEGVSKHGSFLRKLKPPSKANDGTLRLCLHSRAAAEKILQCGFLNCLHSSYSFAGSWGTTGMGSRGWGLKASEFLFIPCFARIWPARLLLA